MDARTSQKETEKELESTEDKQNEYSIKVNINIFTPYQQIHQYRMVDDTAAACLGGRFVHNRWPYGSFSVLTRRITLDDISVLVRLHNHYQMDPVSAIHCQLLLDSLTVLGVMIAYDITSQQSWENSKVLIAKLEEYWKSRVSADLRGLHLMLVGCDCDLVDKREVDSNTVRDYADEKGILFVETSAEQCINVDYAFVSFVTHLLSQQTDHHD